MDATLGISNPPAQESGATHQEQPMSVEIIRELLEADATSIDELAVLLGGLSKSGAYRYIESTELRFGQLLMLFRGAGDDRVRRAFLAKLLPASGWHVAQLPRDLDADGDGDIDVDDAMCKAIDAVGRAHQALVALRDGVQGRATLTGEKLDRLQEIRDAFAALTNDGMCGLAVTDFLIKMESARRPARRSFMANGRGASRG